MKKAVIYTRFSPRPDAEESVSCEKQEEVCRAYCEAIGYDVAHVFEDRNISGSQEDRPGLWRAVGAVRRGWVLVVRWRSRLARDVYLSEIIGRTVSRQGGRIEAVEETNGDGPQDRLIRQILQAMSEYERRMIGIRTKYAMQRKQAEGLKMSRLLPYGWRPDPKDPKRMVQDKKEVEVISFMCRLREEGTSYTKIVKELEKQNIPAKYSGRWTPRTIQRILKREGLRV